MPDEHGNTIALIGAWSMDGARDLDGRFQSAVDITAMVSGRSVEPQDSVTPPERPPLLMKSAGEDDWQPLSAVA